MKKLIKIRNHRGFTLIEMLIVVAIIGILSSIVLVGLGPVQRQGRDARRISDLRQTQTALELYYNKNAQYPAATYEAATAWSQFQGVLTGAGIGVNNVPADPRNSETFFYRYWSDGNTYVIGARLEDSSNSALQNDIDGNSLSSMPTVQINCGGSAVPEDPPIYCLSL